MQVRDGMSKVVLTVGPGHTLREAARLMAERHVGAAVVIDPESPGPGILTERDMLDSLGAGQDPDTELVADHLTSDVVFAAPDWSLEEAAVAMVRGGFRHLVVDHGGEVVGMLSVRDIVRCWTDDGAICDVPGQRRSARLRSRRRHGRASAALRGQGASREGERSRAGGFAAAVPGAASAISVGIRRNPDEFARAGRRAEPRQPAPHCAPIDASMQQSAAQRAADDGRRDASGAPSGSSSMSRRVSRIHATITRPTASTPATEMTSTMLVVTPTSASVSPSVSSTGRMLPPGRWISSPAGGISGSSGLTRRRSRRRRR